MLKSLPIIIVFLLTGCVSAYKQPDSGALAQVRFVAPNAEFREEMVSVYIHEADCSNPSKLRQLGGIMQIGSISSDETDLGMLKNEKYKEDQYVEVFVPANETLNFTFAAGFRAAQCHYSASFTPQTDQQYEVIFKAGLIACHVSADAIALENGEYKKEKVESLMVNKKNCRSFFN
jgi:hypothetical protein